MLCSKPKLIGRFVFARYVSKCYSNKIIIESARVHERSIVHFDDNEANYIIN